MREGYRSRSVFSTITDESVAKPTHQEATAVSSDHGAVHLELVWKQGRLWWSANDAITFERSVFNEWHTIKIMKMPSVIVLK